MARLPDVDLTVATEVADVFKRVTESRGWVSNLMRALAHAPEGLQRYAALGHYGRYGTELTELQRELVILATVRGVEYGWTHHGNLARQIGVTDAQLEALKQGRVPDDLGPAERALCDYVFAVTTLRGVPEPVLRGMLQHFTARQVVDVALLSAYYMAAGALIVGLDVELEGPELLRTELEWQKRTLAEGPGR
jgi:4-carboxymuconolactone decarboxylase